MNITEVLGRGSTDMGAAADIVHVHVHVGGLDTDLKVSVYYENVMYCIAFAITLQARARDHDGRITLSECDHFHARL